MAVQLLPTRMLWGEKSASIRRNDGYALFIESTFKYQMVDSLVFQWLEPIPTTQYACGFYKIINFVFLKVKN